MRSYTNLAVVALAASSLCPVLSAPTQYTGRYGNLLVELKEFKGRAFLISGIPISLTVLSMSFVLVPRITRRGRGLSLRPLAISPLTRSLEEKKNKKLKALLVVPNLPIGTLYMVSHPHLKALLVVPTLPIGTLYKVSHPHPHLVPNLLIIPFPLTLITSRVPHPYHPSYIPALIPIRVPIPVPNPIPIPNPRSNPKPHPHAVTSSIGE